MQGSNVRLMTYYLFISLDAYEEAPYLWLPRLSGGWLELKETAGPNPGGFRSPAFPALLVRLLRLS